MKEKKHVRIYIAFAIIVTLAFMCTLIFNSGAWFSTSSQSAAQDPVNLRFGKVSVSVTPTLSLTPTELLPGNTNIQRTISFTNDGTVPCYIRFECEITSNDSPLVITSAEGEEEVITFTVNNAWQEKSGNKYYYGEIDVGETITATLTFSVSMAFGTEFSTESVKLKLKVDSVQSANQSTDYDDIVWAN